MLEPQQRRSPLSAHSCFMTQFNHLMSFIWTFKVSLMEISEKNPHEESYLSCDQVFSIRGERQSCDGLPVDVERNAWYLTF